MVCVCVCERERERELVGVFVCVQATWFTSSNFLGMMMPHSSTCACSSVTFARSSLKAAVQAAI